MGITKHFFSIIGVIALGSCAKSPTPIELATNCIRHQVPEGQNVSAVKAQEVIASCQSSLDAWSRFSVQDASGKPLNNSDEATMAKFVQHRQAAHRYWLSHLSHEYADAHPDYD